jgi:hypothetical protein
VEGGTVGWRLDPVFDEELNAEPTNIPALTTPMTAKMMIMARPTRTSRFRPDWRVGAELGRVVTTENPWTSVRHYSSVSGRDIPLLEGPRS